jgi:PAS domain-containing protein
MPAKLPSELACETTSAPQSADRMDEKALRRAQAATELAIQEAEPAHARLREAIDILPEGIVFLDPEGRYILWNQKYAEIYKRSAERR